MAKTILLILVIIFSGNHAIAGSSDYGSILQQQAKQIQELKNQISALEETVAKLKLDFNKGSLNFKETSTPIEVPKGVAAEANSVQTNTEIPVAPPFVATMPKDKVDYDLALAALKDGDFTSAEQQFAQFIEKYPSSQLQSNATFWYGESFYRRNDFNKAAIHYLQSYKKYPKGSKAPDALLKLSYSLASLNKNKEACAMLTKLELEFPKRPESSIKRAQEAKSKFHCQ